MPTIKGTSAFVWQRADGSVEYKTGPLKGRLCCAMPGDDWKWLAPGSFVEHPLGNIFYLGADGDLTEVTNGRASLN